MLTFFILSGMYENDLNASVTNSGELKFNFHNCENQITEYNLNLFTKKICTLMYH